MPSAAVDVSPGFAAPHDEKTAAIVAAARQTFLAKGFDGASMDEIALTAGVSKRTVYNRFRSKEELFAGVIDEACRRILPFDLEADDAIPFEEFLTQIAERLLHVTLEPDAVALHRIITFEVGRNPALGHTFMECGPRRVFRVVGPYFERQVARGRLRPDTDVSEAMWRLKALLSEPLETMVLMGEPPEDMEAAIAEQVETAVRDFLRLYGA